MWNQNFMMLVINTEGKKYQYFNWFVIMKLL